MKADFTENEALSRQSDALMLHDASGKPALRHYYRQQRMSMAESEYKQGIAAIIQNLQSLPDLRAAQCIHAFWPIDKYKEVDLRPLLMQLHDLGKQIVLPVVLSFDEWKPEAPRLEHRLFDGPDRLVKNKWDVFEPADTKVVAVDSLDLVLVPALAADKRGFRLGYGKGYYDEFLGECNCTTVCPLFANAVTDRLPTSVHDIPVDYIVTEEGVIRLEQM